MAILVHGQDPLIVDLSADVTVIDSVVDDIHNVDLPAIYTGVSTLTTMASGLDAFHQSELDQAANAGDVVLATVNGSVQIESIVVKTKTTHGDLTSIAVTGGAAKVIEFISAASGAAANLDAEDKQVSWTGTVELGDAKTVVITFAGTGANHVTMTATIKYKPCVVNSVLI